MHNRQGQFDSRLFGILLVCSKLYKLYEQINIKGLIIAVAPQILGA